MYCGHFLLLVMCAGRYFSRLLDSVPMIYLAHAQRLKIYQATFGANPSGGNYFWFARHHACKVDKSCAICRDGRPLELTFPTDTKHLSCCPHIVPEPLVKIVINQILLDHI